MIVNTQNHEISSLYFFHSPELIIVLFSLKLQKITGVKFQKTHLQPSQLQLYPIIFQSFNEFLDRKNLLMLTSVQNFAIILKDILMIVVLNFHFKNP